jgi:hypothetical protein
VLSQTCLLLLLLAAALFGVVRGLACVAGVAEMLFVAGLVRRLIDEGGWVSGLWRASGRLGTGGLVPRGGGLAADVGAMCVGGWAGDGY